MKKRIAYTDEPMEVGEAVGFLPPPEKLVLREPTVKVTLSLSKGTVDSFKSSARRHGQRYQRMIRRVTTWWIQDERLK